MLKVEFPEFMMSQDLPNQQEKILVVDDHQLILGGTLEVLRKQYPKAEILTTKTAKETIKQLSTFQPDLIIIDLSIPEKPGVIAQIDTGIQLIQKLMKEYPNLNIMVQTSHPKALVRIRHDIDNHQGGFTVADKGLDDQQRLMRVNLALEGGSHTKDLGRKIEVKLEWLELLRLASSEELQDKAIADQMNISERTVRNYWTKIQDVLSIYPEDSKKERTNIRFKTVNHARQEGLIN
ncbi:MAG: response regulator transcription factor [Rhizonema sp. PD38]|nr:response regulator transcription factor [Rhizonema sp. PD38]